MGGESKRDPLGTFRGASDKGRSVNNSSLSGLSAKYFEACRPIPRSNCCQFACNRRSTYQLICESKTKAQDAVRQIEELDSQR